MSKKIIICFVGFVMAFIGCASLPPAPDSLKQHVIEMEPSKGKALIYYIRKSSVIGGAVLIDVYIDDTYLGSVDNGQFIVSEVDPGHHSLTIYIGEPFNKPDMISRALIDVTNETKIYIASGAMAMPEKVKKEEGLKLLRKYDLSSDNRID